VPSRAASAVPAGWPRDAVPYAAAAFSGLAVCLVIAAATGRREAWDSGLYFLVGIPMMCVAILAISRRFPHRTWRWTLSMAVGQGLSMAIAGSDLSLWPLSIIAMTVVSVPQFITGFVTGRMARARRGG
jgi:hypothetical protein